MLWRSYHAGRFRAAHTELINNGEMVAFMRGERPEHTLLKAKFGAVLDHTKLASHCCKACSINFGAHPACCSNPPVRAAAPAAAVALSRSDIVQSYVNKYFASAVGLVLIVCLPLVFLFLSFSLAASLFFSPPQGLRALSSPARVQAKAGLAVACSEGTLPRCTVLPLPLTRRCCRLETRTLSGVAGATGGVRLEWHEQQEPRRPRGVLYAGEPQHGRHPRMLNTRGVRE